MFCLMATIYFLIICVNDTHAVRRAQHAAPPKCMANLYVRALMFFLNVSTRLRLAIRST
ncbi:Uncharacterised protein [Serratia fonticola]|nr:Uncharacterised protein [Serratia fonticola]